MEILTNDYNTIINEAFNLAGWYFNNSYILNINKSNIMIN